VFISRDYWQSSSEAEFAMFDLDYQAMDASVLNRMAAPDADATPKRGFLVAKRAFDLMMSAVLLPILIVAGAVLLVVNPFCNRGPLLYIQTRMGQDCKPFRAIKFRSMVEVDAVVRRADDPLEHDRITPLGKFLRKSRIDELPQILNVFAGQMSLIGPRPDFYDHALVYLDVVPGYRERHAMKPGISGLAQTELGYIEGLAATERKAAIDLVYIRNASWRLDTWVVWRTLCVVLGRGGK
jgi:lipopolysaccharide/colanic/teichoic acid biosynthesis glycosyltransferase